MGQWLIEDLSVSDVHFQPWMLLVTGIVLLWFLYVWATPIARSPRLLPLPCACLTGYYGSFELRGANESVSRVSDTICQTTRPQGVEVEAPFRTARSVPPYFFAADKKGEVARLTRELNEAVEQQTAHGGSVCT